jgi:hypothetical protein
MREHLNELNKLCVVCGRELGPHATTHCTDRSLVGIENKGLFRKTIAWFSLTDGRQLSGEDMTTLKETETARATESTSKPPVTQVASEALGRSLSVEEPVALPHYSRLKTNAGLELPPDLEARERSDAFTARRKRFQHEILDTTKRPPDDSPLFTVLLIEDGRPVTISVPEGSGQCLLVFSTRVHADDYVRTLLPSAPRLHYDCTTPAQLVGLLRTLREVGVDSFAVDQCPRCSILAAVSSDSMRAAADIVNIWGMRRAFELAWTELYVAYALESARSGRLEVARDVALESVGHVTMEDPRPHLLLGQVAVVVGDRTLLLEAKAFLRFFRFVPWEQKLDEIERSGLADFTDPGERGSKVEAHRPAG